MNVQQAREIARQWVLTEGCQTPGFRGAFLHGSMNWLPGDAVLPASSDVDVMVVLAEANLPNKPGKFLYQNALLEVSYLSESELQSPEQILGRYQIAGSFRFASILADPSDRLTALQATVAPEYARRPWVRKRCEQARDRVLNAYARNDSEPFHDQVIAWLFPTGIMTHVLLVAGLKNPTVRRRYVAARELLAEYDHLELYPTLLELLGCARMNRACVEHHLVALTEVFDAAKRVIRTPFPFAAGISDVARPIAIDGSRELIESGNHREAIFWMAATYSRCQQVLCADATPAMEHQFEPGYRALLRDLGITSSADLQHRLEEVRAHLPRVWNVAEEIMAANPEIEE